MIPAIERLQGVEPLIDSKQYFVIHAARQSGKTTFLKDLTQRLNKEGKYYCLLCSLEALQGVIDPVTGIPQIVKKLRDVFSLTNIPHSNTFAKNADFSSFTNVLFKELSSFSAKLDKPLVILFDEADCLSEGTMITFLRQLRDGHNGRPETPFVHSIALVGLRNIRDYKVHLRPDSESLGTASPFNIVTEALTIENFSREQIKELYNQHTVESGQIFEDDAVELVWQQTQGQPWLVNAIAREVIVKMLEDDYTKPVTAPLVSKAINTIILRRDVHIDSLFDKLKEKRVMRIIEPMILGGDVDTRSADYLYVKDLGLIKEENHRITPANPIYAEVIIRELNGSLQDTLIRREPTLVMPRYYKNDKIDMDYLMRDFQQFWRQNSGIWEEKFEYKEAAPHLILMAFLQRVVNGGGNIIREMAIDTDRLDLYVNYMDKKYPIELKILYSPASIEKGIEQLSGYMDTLGVKDGWLCMFNRKPGVNWEEKIYMKSEKYQGNNIRVVGL
jgi:hypothetical protein